MGVEKSDEEIREIYVLNYRRQLKSQGLNFKVEHFEGVLVVTMDLEFCAKEAKLSINDFKKKILINYSLTYAQPLKDSHENRELLKLLEKNKFNHYRTFIYDGKYSYMISDTKLKSSIIEDPLTKVYSKSGQKTPIHRVKINYNKTCISKEKEQCRFNKIAFKFLLVCICTLLLFDFIYCDPTSLDAGKAGPCFLKTLGIAFFYCFSFHMYINMLKLSKYFKLAYYIFTVCSLGFLNMILLLLFYK